MQDHIRKTYSIEKARTASNQTSSGFSRPKAESLSMISAMTFNPMSVKISVWKERLIKSSGCASSRIS